MSEQFQKLSRPVATESQDLSSRPSIAIQRNKLTLFLSLAAITLSSATAIVNLYIFVQAGQQKALNEANQILVHAEANQILEETNRNPRSHAELNAELQKLYANLQYYPRPDAPLTIYERAAFALAVETYAKPITAVQLQRLEAMQAGSSLMSPSTLQSRKSEACFVDPFEEGCPAYPGFERTDR
jgi:hypothetical protein